MQHLFLHALDRLIYSVMYVSFIALPFLTFNLVRYGWSRRSKGAVARRFPFFSACFFVGPILIGLAGGHIIKAAAVDEIKAFIDGAADATVSVNGTFVADPAPILKALHSMEPMGWMKAHHSHATTRLHIVISSGAEKLALDLGRDSQDPREYWVFFSKSRNTQEEEIDRIVSDAFDAY